MLEINYINNFSDFYNRHCSFIKDRYQEAAELCGTDRELCPDIKLFQQLIDLKSMIVLEIKEDENFIGYCSIVLSPSLLSKGYVDARIEHLAFSEDVRKKGLGSAVLKKIEDVVKDNSSDELSIALPPTNLHREFATKNGYSSSIEILTKHLG